MGQETEIVFAGDAGISINEMSDISDALSACLGRAGLILTERDLGEEFFNLRSGLAGELFQKFINYQLKLAIVIVDHEAYGERFSELAFEHRSHPAVRFVRSTDEAVAWLNDR